jgi:hypothetical protein
MARSDPHTAPLNARAMKLVRIAISVFIGVLIVTASAGLVWTGANQPPAQSRASWIVLIVGIGAGVVGLIKLWLH